jgi:hypothetical protein
MMRITATISDDMVMVVKDLTGARTKTEAVNMALAEWIRLKKLTRIKELRGKINIASNKDEMNSLEIKEVEELNA